MRASPFTSQLPELAQSRNKAQKNHLELSAQQCIQRGKIRLPESSLRIYKFSLENEAPVFTL
jgi:hypothetical protein